MNRAKLGIVGLVGIMTGLLILAAVNVQPLFSDSHENQAGSVLMMLGYEPGNAQPALPAVSRPVLVECPERAPSRPATV
ncbi:hypothetical protein [Pedomonas mirosovicensis]|uniref:hypothetical protein n=1 Tax=Pedomonas mirosovicensis TaxID=2908641 RepID=UPI0021678D65|nr:hypothetical protein [Pedomonas mirosovicensis]MCH8683793.1 hypothetical protein [Pedomonas mirosovicensis]